MIENTRQIVKNLILKTDSREIKWIASFENSDKVIFVYTKNITEKKKLTFEVILRRDRYLSELVVKFGPIGNSKFAMAINHIDLRKQSLLYDLLDSLQRKYNDGDINHIDGIKREKSKWSPVIQFIEDMNKPYEEITSFFCTSRNLKNLDGIEKLINLETLSCSFNELTDLKGIENLTKIRRLYCSYNSLTHLKEIEKLVNLKNLNCVNNNFSEEYKNHIRKYCDKKNIQLYI